MVKWNIMNIFKLKVQLPEEEFVEEVNTALRSDLHQNQIVNTVSKERFQCNLNDSYFIL